MVKRIQPHKLALCLGGSRIKKNRAQSVLEYSAVIACLVAALLAMQVYIKRGMQGRLRQLGDNLGQQYSPGNTTGSSTLAYDTQATNQVQTFSEYELNYIVYPNKTIYPIFDLNGNGKYDDHDVFATESLAVYGDLVDIDDDGILDKTVGGSTTTQKGEEKVGPLETKLFP